MSAAAPAAPAPARPAILSGRPASPGFAAGPLVVQAERAHGRRRAGSPAEERAALQAALATAAADLAALAAQASGDAADILEFQIALIEDDALSGPALDAIASGTPAERAWADAIGVLITDYEATEDDYFRARAADLRDLAERVAMALSGEALAGMTLPEGAVLFATDLAPSRFLAAEWSGRGIALSAGSATSHVAMLARARGVPMVTGLGPIGAAARAGVDALLDGEAGTLTLSPDAATTAAFAARRHTAEAAAVHAAAAATGAAVTADGVAIAVHINVADPAELDRLDPAILRRHRAGAHRAPLPRPRRAARRGGTDRRLPPDPRLGGRQASDDPHPRRRRRQADPRIHARRRDEPLPRPARRAPVARPAGGVRGAAAGAAGRRHRRRPQGDDPDGVGAGRDGARPRRRRRSRRGTVGPRRGLPRAADRHDGGSARRGAGPRRLRHRLRPRSARTTSPSTRSPPDATSPRSPRSPTPPSRRCCA